MPYYPVSRTPGLSEPPVGQPSNLIKSGGPTATGVVLLANYICCHVNATVEFVGKDLIDSGDLAWDLWKVLAQVAHSS